MKNDRTSDRSCSNRVGAFALHSKYDSRELTARARAARWAKYLVQVDPDQALPEAERIRRAECARRADMARMALKSVKARRAKSARKRHLPTDGEVA